MFGKSAKKDKPVAIGDLMADSTAGFGRVLKRARALERLGRKVMPLLEPELAQYCTVANVREGRLILGCTSPVCATRLRMEAPKLIDRLHQAGLTDIESVVVKMMPEGHGRPE